jgi:hypothetical protein
VWRSNGRRLGRNLAPPVERSAVIPLGVFGNIGSSGVIPLFIYFVRCRITGIIVPPDFSRELEAAFPPLVGWNRRPRGAAFFTESIKQKPANCIQILDLGRPDGWNGKTLAAADRLKGR